MPEAAVVQNGRPIAGLIERLHVGLQAARPDPAIQGDGTPRAFLAEFSRDN